MSSVVNCSPVGIHPQSMTLIPLFFRRALITSPRQPLTPASRTSSVTPSPTPSTPSVRPSPRSTSSTPSSAPARRSTVSASRAASSSSRGGGGREGGRLRISAAACCLSTLSSCNYPRFFTISTVQSVPNERERVRRLGSKRARASSSSTARSDLFLSTSRFPRSLCLLLLNPRRLCDLWT